MALLYKFVQAILNIDGLFFQKGSYDIIFLYFFVVQFEVFAESSCHRHLGNSNQASPPYVRMQSWLYSVVFAIGKPDYFLMRPFAIFQCLVLTAKYE
jgi:hypothetical protein